jgi:hypothetical protein
MILPWAWGCEEPEKLDTTIGDINMRQASGLEQSLVT